MLLLRLRPPPIRFRFYFAQRRPPITNLPPPAAGLGWTGRPMAQHHIAAGDDDLHTITTMDLEPPYKLPGKVFRMLYPHQQEGLRWLCSLHCTATGGILADDMGLGKTMLVSAFLAGLYRSELINRTLIVAPKTVLAHWMNELSLVGLKHRIRDYSGTSLHNRSYQLQCVFKEGGILLTTYDIVRNNCTLIRGKCYSSNGDNDEEETVWDYVILDEGHFIKNLKTQRAQSLLQIPSAHRIVITGTPFQNNLKEMWALFCFCCPDVLGDMDEFIIRYEKPLLCGNDKNATDQEKHMASEAAKELRERTKPYFLRRLKSEVFGDGVEDKNLPQKNELIIWLKLTSCQRQLYEAFVNSQLDHSQTEAPKGSSLEAITILKKICDHPLLLAKMAAEDIVEGTGSMNNQYMCMVEKIFEDKVHVDNMLQVDQDVSCKIAFILPLLRNLVEEGHNVLIFSQTCQMLNVIQEAVSLEGHKFLRIDGTTKVSKRVKIVKDFQEGSGAPIFLLTSQVSGLGNALTKADRVIVVEPAWNPSIDNHCIDHAYRIGQTKDVIVYRLLTCGTIEEKIYKQQVFKAGIFRTAMEHKDQTQYFNQEVDIHKFFSLPPKGFDVSLTQHQLQEEHGQQLDIKFVEEGTDQYSGFNTPRNYIENLDESLRKHIQFLEQHGIAGVNHHSLLFHKPAAMATLEDSIALDRRPKDIMARRYYAKNWASPASKQKDEWLAGPGIKHAYTDASSLMERREVNDDTPMKIRMERATEVKEMMKEMDHLEGTMRQITYLEQEYVSELVEVLDRTSWDRRHLQKIREQIDNLHQEYTAGFDEMVEGIRSRRSKVQELRMRVMETHTVDVVRRDTMELDEELIAELDKMVERMMMQTIKLDGEVVTSLASICCQDHFQLENVSQSCTCSPGCSKK